MKRSVIGSLLMLLLAFGLNETRPEPLQAIPGSAAGEDASSEERDEQACRTSGSKRARDPRYESDRAPIIRILPGFQREFSILLSSQARMTFIDPHAFLQILRI